MKKLLSILAILCASSTYANCPAMKSISIIHVDNVDHFAAPDSFGSGIWVDSYKTSGILPITGFWRASGLQDPNPSAPRGQLVGLGFVCGYEGPNAPPFTIEAPDQNKYQIDLSPKYQWKINPYNQYQYECMSTNIDDCPFTLVQ